MTRGRLTAYLAVALLAYAATLASTLPAAWVAYGVQRYSNARLEIREPAGTAWAGSGRLTLSGAPSTPVDLGPVRWTSSAASLLAMKVRAEVFVGASGKPMLLELSPWSAAIRSLEVAFPGAAVTALVPALATFGPEGSVHIRSDALRIEGSLFAGLVDIEWRHVQLASPPGLQLGSHVARLRGAGEKIDIDVQTLEGPLLVRARGTWHPAGGLAISGIAEPKTRELVPFLSGLCASYRDARCEFSYGGPVPTNGQP